MARRSTKQRRAARRRDLHVAVIAPAIERVRTARTALATAVPTARVPCDGCHHKRQGCVLVTLSDRPRLLCPGCRARLQVPS